MQQALEGLRRMLDATSWFRRNPMVLTAGRFPPSPPSRHLPEIPMHRPWLSSPLAVVVFVLGVAAAPAAGAQPEFPFGRELLLDAPPMKGSKRVPSLDIGENGLADIELWCNAVKGQLVVAGDTITILTGARTERPCTPERMRGDDDMLSALTEVTNWRREGEFLVLTGARTMRFRMQTN
jgi:heat shock protein HslJ